MATRGLAWLCSAEGSRVLPECAKVCINLLQLKQHKTAEKGTPSGDVAVATCLHVFSRSCLVNRACAAGAGDVDGRRGARVPGAGAARVGARGGCNGRHRHRDDTHAWPHQQGAPLALRLHTLVFAPHALLFVRGRVRDLVSMEHLRVWTRAAMALAEYFGCVAELAYGVKQILGLSHSVTWSSAGAGGGRGGGGGGRAARRAGGHEDGACGAEA